MPFVDYFCPMVYPSHYGPFTFGFAVPNEHPYEVIDETLEIMNEQAKGLPMKIRPWIQDFGYGAVPRLYRHRRRGGDAGAARQRRPGLDDLERARVLHRVGAGPAAATGEDAGITTAAR